MKFFKLTLLFVLLVGSAAWLSAQTVVPASLSYLSVADREALQTTGTVKVLSDSLNHLRLWKASPFESSVRALFGKRPSTLAAEAYFLLPSALPADPAQRDLLLKRAITAISTMKDLQVFSVSLQRMETFIFDAYLTKTTDKKTRLADPIVNDLSDLSFLMFQNEEQTGESFSDVTFQKKPGWLQLTLTNQTSLNYAFVPLVSPHDLLTAIYIVPTDGQLLVYGVTVAKTFSLFGLERSKTTSLYNRMEALVTWLKQNLKNGL